LVIHDNLQIEHTEQRKALEIQNAEKDSAIFHDSMPINSQHPVLSDKDSVRIKENLHLESSYSGGNFTDMRMSNFGIYNDQTTSENQHDYHDSKHQNGIKYRAAQSGERTLLTSNEFEIAGSEDKIHAGRFVK